MNSAIEFLQNPSMINQDLDLIKKFLKNRGLSDSDISYALEKSGFLDISAQKWVITS